MRGGLRAPLVAVCGASSATDSETALAEAVGRLLAGRGATLVCGGLSGVMEAACRGAAAAGGVTVGLLPGEDPGAANPHVQLALPTGLGEARNALIARACRGMIAIGGGHGTLSEIAFMLRLGRPVCGLGSWELISPHPEAEMASIHAAQVPEEAVAWVMDRI